MATKNEPADENDDKAALAAQAEAEDIDEMTVVFGEHSYQVSRRAVGSAQFRYLIQRSRDALACEMLLGLDGFQKFLTDQVEPSTEWTPSVKLWEFLNAAGKELGMGNR